ncbi:murein hydrolase activator NlpD precursor [bacterium BMS3Bbin10]|nr:murein hydrolase activator NlpD precursor [bacterium BMS3Bbin10]
MSGMKQFIANYSAMRGVAGKILALGLVAVLGACSGNVSRFDYPVLSNNSADDSLTTASLSPIPSEAVYQYGAGANSTAVVRQDLPPPGSQVAAVEPRQVQPAPLPPQQQYQAPPQQQYQAPSPQPQYRAPPPQYQAPQPVAPPPPANMVVRVKQGDTLYKLAERHGVSIDEIKTANSLKNTRLSIGQELTIPVRGGPAPATTNVTYTVKRGDSIDRIARAHNISKQELLSANNISRPDVLRLGQKLEIPGQRARVARAQAPIRLASRGADMPLPSTNPARARPSAPLPEKSAASTQRKTASRSKSLPSPEPMNGNQFRWPVKGRIVSGFGAKPGGKQNDGINVAVPRGTSIKAAENGVVAYAGNELEPYGNLILIRHANNWVTAYAHNEKLIVKRGDTVRRGQIIAKAGQTGNVSQPQLHFELRKGSKPVNPLSYMANS